MNTLRTIWIASILCFSISTHTLSQVSDMSALKKIVIDEMTISNNQEILHHKEHLIGLFHSTYDRNILRGEISDSKFSLRSRITVAGESLDSINNLTDNGEIILRVVRSEFDDWLTISLSGNIDEIDFFKVKLNDFYLDTPDWSKINTVYMDEVLFGEKTNITFDEIDSIYVENIRLDASQRFILHFVEKPKYLSINNFQSDNKLDLSETFIFKEGTTALDIDQKSIASVDLNYSGFRLAYPKTTLSEFQYEKWSMIFEALINKFRSSGQELSLEAIDKEYEYFKVFRNPESNFFAKYLTYPIRQLWNDFGYKKERIWLITGILFVLFFLINWLKFPTLQNRAYSATSLDKAIQNIDQAINAKDLEEENYRLPRTYSLINFKYFHLAIWYTAIVFFGLKLNASNFHFNNIRGVIYIGFQYVMGLICLGYLANLIIIK